MMTSKLLGFNYKPIKRKGQSTTLTSGEPTQTLLKI